MKVKPIPASFSQSEMKDGRAHKGTGNGKMVEAAGGARVENEALTKADLIMLAKKIDGLELELLKKLTDLVTPLRTAGAIKPGDTECL